MTSALVTYDMIAARQSVTKKAGAPHVADIGKDNGEIFVKNNKGFIWLREVLSVDATTGATTYGQAYQARSQKPHLVGYGIRVRVQYDGFDDEWEVTQTDFNTLVDQGINPSIENPNNPYAKEFDMRSLPPLLTYAVSSGATATTEVSVMNLIYIDYLGDLKAFQLPNGSRPDIGDNEPGTGLKRLVHLWLNHDNTVTQSVSTPISVAADFSIAVDLAEAMQNPPNNLALPIGAWSIENGATAITADNFEIDTRPWLRPADTPALIEPITKNYVVPVGTQLNYHEKLTITGKITVNGKLSVIGDNINITKNEVTFNRANTLVDNTKIQIYQPSVVTNVTAAGGITVTNTLMRVQGNGGAIDITANPQVTAGVDGQFLILEGEDDTNTVTLETGNGLHLHGGRWIGGENDSISLKFDLERVAWVEISRNNSASEKSWTFASPAGTSGTFYAAGYYDFASTDNDFSPSVNFGTANAPYAAHFLTVLGANTVDTLTIRVTGTSITDNGVRTGADTEDIVYTHPALVDDYRETNKKFIGLVSAVVLSGTAKTCNYGWSAYYDRNNSNFRVTGLEALFLGGANDSSANLTLLHHKTTGWTFNSGSTPTPPTAIADMQTDYNTEFQVKNGESGKWKRSNLSTVINGSTDEGIIFQIDTSANKTFEPGLNSLMLSIIPQ